ncbi:DNA polymerase II [Aliiglaciecola sp. NS0011-25]|uniref:DNA polymerase II n=1 Tax=Aliiglaciecola sp. NS0011-25 TaxID=3127654 RepID=UPI003106FD20
MQHIPQKGFILTRKVVERNGCACIEFWLSTEQGPVKIITDQQKPVMFIANHDVSRARALLNQSGIALEFKSVKLKTFEQTSVNALYFATTGPFYRARDILAAAKITAFENDIRLPDRYMMERFICAGAYFTGEVQNEQSKATSGYISLKNARLKPADYIPKLTLVSLDIECSMDGELYSIGLSSGDFKQVIMIGQPEDNQDWLIWVEDEKRLIEQLNLSITHFDPDLIIGWNIINFDFKVLTQRANKLNVRLRLGRDGSDVYWRESRNDSNQAFMNIAGRVVIDGIDSLKTATYHFDSFSLENVAQALLGEGKDTTDVDNRVAAITHDFNHNKLKLAKYNLQDCVLVERIFEHTNLISYLLLRSQLTGLELDKIGGSVAAFINLYLPKLHRSGYVSPNRPANGGLASPGGYVMDSFPGLYKNVLVLDFKSLYPSIIRTFKIDPLGLVEGLLEPENAIPGFRGGLFSRDKHFLPDIITSLWRQRDEAKRQQDTARSQAIKIIMNSFYGVLGSGGCPFYDTRLASSITMRGHEIMQTTAAWIEEKGYKVIYGDTDSTFVWLENTKGVEQALDIGKTLEREINQMWQQKIQQQLDLTCHLEIEFETLFSTFLMPTIRGAETGSKKRYAGLKYASGKQPELIFKGLETVRSDWTKLAKEFQPTLYRMVFANQDVSAYLLNVIRKIRSGECDEQLVYRKRLRQPLVQYTKNVPPHVKAARIADEQNKQLNKPLRYQNKGWISYVITLDGPQPVDYIHSALDYEHYIDKQIRPIAEGILPFINVSFEDITSDQLGLF